MYSFGIDIFVIDAFNKVLLPKGNKLEEINIVLTKLTHFAQSNNVIVFLVAHPTKMQKMNKVYTVFLRFMMFLVLLILEIKRITDILFTDIFMMRLIIQKMKQNFLT